MIIDATDTILGRLASFAAKRSLLGEVIEIVNCERAVITGNRAFTLSLYDRRRRMGTPAKGPHVKRSPEEIVKRVIRGMLPYKSVRGREALRRIKICRGMPQPAPKDIIVLKEFNVSKLNYVKYIPVSDICRHIGGRL